MTSSVTCSGSAVASTIIALMPPVSAISGTIGPPLAASARLIACATATEPVNATPADAGVGDQHGADLAVARHQMQRRARHAGVMQKPHRAGGDERRLLGRLGDHRVAGGKRRHDLTAEDREREIPRADADEDAAPAIAQRVALPGRARHRLVLQKPPGLRRIVAT